jgi:hypothetical protein
VDQRSSPGEDLGIGVPESLSEYQRSGGVRKSLAYFEGSAEQDLEKCVFIALESSWCIVVDLATSGGADLTYASALLVPI